MIGRINPKFPEATVVGAGVSGLLVAYYLNKQGFEVTLIEAQERSGGLIQTVPTPFGMAEEAAHSFLATPTSMNLCNEIGVPLCPVAPQSRARYILRDSRMRRFPLRLTETLETVGRVFFAKSKNTNNNQTLELWGKTHLGQGALNYVLTPFVCGIYGATPAELTLGTAFPFLHVPHGKTLVGTVWSTIRKKRQTPGSKRRNRSRPKMMAPQKGMGQLVRQLEMILEKELGKRFVKGHRIEKLPDSPNLVLTTPTYVTAAILEKQAPRLSQSLYGVDYTPMLCATVFIPKNAFVKPIRGIGVLIPPQEGKRTLGVLFNSSQYPDRVSDSNTVESFTLMLGGSHQKDLLDWSDDDIQTMITEELKPLLRLRSSPEYFNIKRQPKAIPKYSEALSKAWKTARDGWCAQPGRVLFGNFSGQVSLRGMIQSASEIVDTVS